MYLARIEMTGFKSFADKTVIEFDKGMTAVVGPNGSGKSNLSEAIRWVLGEQSAKSLRGSRMEDVIFNGTQDRKAVNLAKVTLVLNNEDRYLDYDFSEISITRSYNRNGDSQYFINNEAVRLKDIVDLLLDSGLGKNSFAMISQGKVETIFLNKPEERRSIFEEAAGVQKYQFRKQEAERKLNRSSDHLSRVKDIIHELENQLKPLKKQREAALVYQEKKELLQQLEISLYCYQVALYREQWHRSKEEYAQVSKAIDVLVASLTALEHQLSQEQASLDALIQQIDEQSERNQEQFQAIERAKAQQQMLAQRIEFNASSQQDKQVTYDKQVAMQASLQEQLIQEQAAYETLRSELKALRTQLQQQQKDKQLLTSASGSQVEQLRNQLIDAYQQEAMAKNQSTQQAQLLETATVRREQLTNTLSLLATELTQYEAQLEHATRAKEEMEANHQSTRHNYHELLNQAQQLRIKREQLQQQLFNQERRTQFLDAKVQSLRQMQEDYAGYYGGVRAVMKKAAQLHGIEGTVADLIEVPTHYQVAIDTALGAALQHIVVSDDRAAREAIQYLKQQQAGRATFLPRTNIKERVLASHHYLTASAHEGFVGVASEIVSFDHQNKAIVSNLLGTTIVVEQLKQAQVLARELKQQVKIVTLEGDVLMPGGSVTGGRQKQQAQSMLSRQNELKQAEQELQTAQQASEQLEGEWQQLLTTEQTLNQQLEQLRQTTTQSDSNFQQVQQRFLEAEHALKQKQQAQLIAQDDLQQAEQQLLNAQALLEQVNVQAEESRARIVTLNHELEQLTLSEEDRQEQLQTIEQSIAQLSTQIAVKEVEFRQGEQQVAQLGAQLNELLQAISQYELMQSQDSTDMEQLVADLQQLDTHIEQDVFEAERAREQLNQLRQERQQLNQMYREHEQEQREQAHQSQQLHQQQAKLQGQVEKFEAFIDNHLEYLAQEYQLSYEAATKLANPIEEVQQVSQEVKQLKRSIEQLGPINLAAIEDYDILNERYQHLLEQQEDLLTAMGQLQETMDEMDAEVIKRFSETFTQINHQFQRTFKKLFAGGEASLELTNPNDILTTGVDIIAQPPGKRKQNLALLSGGERAFTAIALLFAILETKPVPFCVLDEVEAALDDANVYRYGQYLQNFTENTQFIVITHRKGTMENADVLYGVTMEQSGVSKLASVRLSDAEFAE
ncbi:chromosome segregation protein SMC [Aerococcaceae bacterium NML210727]|nr:chromosome segregation protein SMC [Aerococcaceae bacterium NML210727]MCW6655313.1 chromosome segregation protein SMC [Aerococcaceae bacterium NML201296]